MSKSTNDFRHIRDVMDRYSSLKRNSNHEIRDFYPDVCRDPAKRRWVCTANRTDPRAVENAKSELRRILVDFDGMMLGTYKRPTVVRAELAPPKPTYQLPMRPPLEPMHDNFDWKSVVPRPLSPFATDGITNVHQSVVRTLFNEHLKAANAIKTRLDDNVKMLEEIQAMVDQDREMYNRAFVFLDKCIELENTFSKLPALDVNTRIFHISDTPMIQAVPDPLPPSPPEPPADVNHKRRVDAGKFATPLMLAVASVLRGSPEAVFTADGVCEALIASGYDSPDRSKLANCLANSLANKSDTLRVKRIAHGKYQWDSERSEP